MFGSIRVSVLVAAIQFMGLHSISVAQPYAGTYAPSHDQCPPNTAFIRPAVGLNPLEADWIHGRKQIVATALSEYIERLEIRDFNVTQYTARLRDGNFENVPIMGLAISGGGWAYTGTGALRALDSRLDAAVDQKTGGLLQCMTYMAGLSGGSFPTISFATSNFPTADEILNLWQPQIDRLNNVTNDTRYAATFTSVFEDLSAKLEAGFPVGTPDLLGRLWGYEFIPGLKGGLNVTFSSIVNLSNFVTHQMPFPIIQVIQLSDTDAQLFNLSVPVANATIYDITPYEFGAWGGSASSFIQTQYLGTILHNGLPVNESECVVGFDRASFMMGLTSAAFNLWEVEIDSNGTEGNFAKTKRSLNHAPLRKREEIIPASEASAIVAAFRDVLHLNLTDIAYAQVPNPFLGMPSASAYTQKTSTLNFVDGSESGQTIPLSGLVQPVRNTSFIIAWDDTNDAVPYLWNNGTNLYNTYVQAAADGTPFPIIPPPSTFVGRKYTERPVFFGCDKHLTTTQESTAPIVLYLANAPYTSYLNFTANKGVMTPQRMDDIFMNSFAQLTQGNGTLDHEWPICLGCAAIERSLEKVGMERPRQCDECFQKYCWDGLSVDYEVGIVDLSLVLNPNVGYEAWLEGHAYWNSTLSSA